MPRGYRTIRVSGFVSAQNLLATGGKEDRHMKSTSLLLFAFIAGFCQALIRERGGRLSPTPFVRGTNLG